MGVTTTRGTVLKGCSVRKGENHWSNKSSQEININKKVSHHSVMPHGPAYISNNIRKQNMSAELPFLFYLSSYLRHDGYMLTGILPHLNAHKQITVKSK